MVWQERYYAEPKDILSFRLTCKRCDGNATVRITFLKRAPIAMKDGFHVVVLISNI